VRPADQILTDTVPNDYFISRGVAAFSDLSQNIECVKSAAGLNNAVIIDVMILNPENALEG